MSFIEFTVQFTSYPHHCTEITIHYVCPGWEGLPHFTRLTLLALTSATLDDASFHSIRALTTLQVLDLRAIQLQEHQQRQLHFPFLTRLELAEASSSDVAFLSAHTQLRRLIAGPHPSLPIGNDYVEALTSMPHLTFLHLYSAQNISIPLLLLLTSLRELHLCGARFPKDGAVAALCKLPSLEELYLGDCQYPSSFDALREFGALSFISTVYIDAKTLPWRAQAQCTAVKKIVGPRCKLEFQM